MTTKIKTLKVNTCTLLVQQSVKFKFEWFSICNVFYFYEYLFYVKYCCGCDNLTDGKIKFFILYNK